MRFFVQNRELFVVVGGGGGEAGGGYDWGLGVGRRGIWDWTTGGAAVRKISLSFFLFGIHSNKLQVQPRG